MEAIKTAPLLVGVIKYIKEFMGKNMEIVESMDKLYIKRANDEEKIVVDYGNDYKEYLKDIKIVKYKIKKIFKICATTKNNIESNELIKLLDNEKNKTSFYLDLENNEPELTEEYEGTILREDLDNPRIDAKLENIKEKIAAACLVYEILTVVKPYGIIDIEITQEYIVDSSLFNIREIFKLDFFRFYVLIDITENLKPYSTRLDINYIDVKQKDFSIT